jgi:hypothetical protein
MKNIHIFPTDKPTRLFTSDSELTLAGYPKTTFKTGKNIYITNDEKPKLNDWFLDTIDKVVFKVTHEDILTTQLDGLPSNFKKIILTTDQDLIKDGVQPIPDEFLEWFVKNPSCESVEVKISHSYLKSKKDILTPYYKIIIPKEEPKHESQGEYICPATKKLCDDECCTSPNNCNVDLSGKLKDSNSKEIDFDKLVKLANSLVEISPKENDEAKKKSYKESTEEENQPKQRLEKYSERFDNNESAIGNPETWGRRIKQETLEEVAERILANNIDGLRDALNDDDLFFFYKGVIQCYGEAMAKWQQEQMYSEEDMDKAFDAGLNYMKDGNLNKNEWFEQFKNK